MFSHDFFKLVSLYVRSASTPSTHTHTHTYTHTPQVRPGTEDDDLDEPIQTVVLSDVKSGGSRSTSPQDKTEGKKQAGKSPSDDPEASLITDFQIITDIRVCVDCLLCIMYAPLTHTHTHTG